MVLFSQIALLVLTMLAPLIFLVVFAYIKAGGWKPIVWGILFSLAALVILRLLLPVLLFSQSWFQALVADMPLYVLVYSLGLALLYLAGGWLYIRRLLPHQDLTRTVVFGFSEGFAYEALFIGFNGVASLLSNHAPQPGIESVGGIWLAIIEALAVLILFTGFALMLCKGILEKKPLWTLASFAGTFLFFFAGLSWSAVWGWPRAALELVLIGVSLWIVWWLKSTVPWKTVFRVEEDSEGYEFDDSVKDTF